jgi:hypothetical protein
MEVNFVTGIVSLATAAKTLIGTVTVPLGVTKLVEVGTSLSSLGLTTLFSYDHILELECSDAGGKWGGTQQFAFGGPAVLGTDLGPELKAQVRDCDIDVAPTSHITFSVTSSCSPTIKPGCRGFGKFR